MKRDYVVAAFIVLLFITILSVVREHQIQESLADLKGENEQLAKQVASLEKVVEEGSSTTDILVKENSELTKTIADLEDELQTQTTPVEYQDYLDAIDSIDIYKETETFEEASKFIAFKIGNGLGVQNSSYKCPCSFIFDGRSIEWLPNVVQELKEIRTEKDKIFLSYKTTAEIEYDYQFVMSKGPGLDNPTEKWRIEEIILVDKKEEKM